MMWFVLTAMFLVLSGFAHALACNSQRDALLEMRVVFARIHKRRARAFFWFAFWFFVLAIACMATHLTAYLA